MTCILHSASSVNEVDPVSGRDRGICDCDRKVSLYVDANVC